MNQALRVVVVVLAFVGIFLAGAITGGVTTAQFIERRRAPFERERFQEHQRLVAENASLRQQLQLDEQKLRSWRPPARGRQGGPWQDRRRAAPEQFGTELMQRFVNQVHPTPAQREQIRPLVFQAGEDLRRLRRDTANNAEIIVERLEDQISAVLAPAQRDRFDDLIQRWRDAFSRYNRQMQQMQAKQRQREMQEIRPRPSPPPQRPAAPSSSAIDSSAERRQFPQPSPPPPATPSPAPGAGSAPAAPGP